MNKKVYLISFVKTKIDGKGKVKEEFLNEFTSSHPLEWLKQANNNVHGVKFVLLNWMEVTEKQYEQFMR